jgi:hypothetical protein
MGHIHEYIATTCELGSKIRELPRKCTPYVKKEFGNPQTPQLLPSDFLHSLRGKTI